MYHNHIMVCIVFYTRGGRRATSASRGAAVFVSKLSLPRTLNAETGVGAAPSLQPQQENSRERAADSNAVDEEEAMRQVCIRNLFGAVSSTSRRPLAIAEKFLLLAVRLHDGQKGGHSSVLPRTERLLFYQRQQYGGKKQRTTKRH